jgi:hypothetical protein
LTWATTPLTCVHVYFAPWANSKPPLTVTVTVTVTVMVTDYLFGWSKINDVSHLFLQALAIDVGNYITATPAEVLIGCFHSLITAGPLKDRPAPDLVTFKQSIHLIPHALEAVAQLPQSRLMIVQFRHRPFDGLRYPLGPCDPAINVRALTAAGRSVKVVTLHMNFELSKLFFKELVLTGYVSELMVLSPAEREAIWAGIEARGSYLMRETLDVILAGPVQVQA